MVVRFALRGDEGGKLLVVTGDLSLGPTLLGPTLGSSKAAVGVVPCSFLRVPSCSRYAVAVCCGVEEATAAGATAGWRDVELSVNAFLTTEDDEDEDDAGDEASPACALPLDDAVRVRDSEGLDAPVAAPAAATGVDLSD